MGNNTFSEKIDLVYLWVNGNDPEWCAKRNTFTDKKTQTGSAENCEGRYANHNELKYSLRSIELYAPWIHKIFIITDNQIPEWLDTSNPKIRIVDHTEILPPQCIPCFNSTVIEHCIPHIPGLSERFLLANDDTFLGRPVTPDMFFAADGFPIIRLYHKYFRKLALFYRERILKKTLENYPQIIKNSAALVEKKYGIYFGSKSHHNIDAFLKSDYIRVEEMFKAAIEPTFINHMRKPNDIHHRHLYFYTTLAEKRAHRIYVNQKTSFHFLIHHNELYPKIEAYNPTFFCMNDNQFANENDRVRMEKYLMKRFPKKSSFEK